MARILHVVGGSKYGGGSVLIERFATEAMQHGHDVFVLATDAVFQGCLRNAGVGVVNLDCIWRPIRPIRDIGGLVRLRRYLAKNRYDIVHTHGSKGGFVGRLAARLADVPVVIHTVHGFAFHEASTPSQLLFYSFLERMAARFCDALVTVSKFHCDWAARLRIGNERTRLAIPNGIDPDRVKPTHSRAEVRTDLGVSDGEIVFLTMGRLAKQKGVEVLLQALAQLNVKIPVLAIIAGDGENRLTLEQMALGLNLGTRVTFLGFRTDLGDLLSAADIVVLPSLWEGLSISLLEAMAAGKPIITTDIGSNLEVTRNGEAARIVRAGDVSQLAGAIEELACDEKERGELSSKASAVFQCDYTEELMLSRYMALYKRLLNAKRLND